MQQSWQVLREHSPRGSYVRRRVGAVAAATAFGVAWLAVLGFGRVVMLVLLATLALAGATVCVLLLRRLRPWRFLPRTAAQLAPGVRSAGTSAWRRARVARTTARRHAGVALADVRRRERELRPVAAQLAARARPVATHLAAQARTRVAQQLGTRPDDRRRREGAHEAAASRHHAALEIYRALGDSHAEALTLNNVALAEARAGDDEAAVGHFEAALALLRELDNPNHEAQVTANLGVVLRRGGHGDRARELLEAALEHLDPQSPAARQVEVQLRRAS